MRMPVGFLLFGVTIINPLEMLCSQGGFILTNYDYLTKDDLLKV